MANNPVVCWRIIKKHSWHSNFRTNIGRKLRCPKMRVWYWNIAYQGRNSSYACQGRHSNCMSGPEYEINLPEPVYLLPWLVFEKCVPGLAEIQTMPARAKILTASRGRNSNCACQGMRMWYTSYWHKTFNIVNFTCSEQTAHFCGVSSVRKHFSLEAANFSLFSQEGEVTSSLIPGPAWSLRYSSPNISRYAPMNFFFFFFFFFCNSTYSLYPEHWIIQEPVFVLHLFTCHGRIMPRSAEPLFLLLILLTNLRNLFIDCINVDIDEVLLLDENKGIMAYFFRVILFRNSWKGVLVSASYLAKSFQESFLALHRLWYRWDAAVGQK